MEKTEVFTRAEEALRDLSDVIRIPKGADSEVPASEKQLVGMLALSASIFALAHAIDSVEAKH